MNEDALEYYDTKLQLYLHAYDEGERNVQEFKRLILNGLRNVRMLQNCWNCFNCNKKGHMARIAGDPRRIKDMITLWKKRK